MNCKEIIEQSFTQYAGAVLQSRALVDVRDCIKPSTRQILYCLYTDKFTSDKPFKKTLKALGSAARLHIHGDASAEGIIMRSAQPFAMRYPLIEVEGSYGNLMESGNWAAPRYTSSRLNALSEQIFEGLNKNAIETWYDNYDETEQYPSVLPSVGFYNIVNGTLGIGIGMASSIPSTNLREVNEAIIKLIQNPNTDFDEVMCWPDFPTGGILLNKTEVKESFKNGSGKACKIRSVIKYEPAERCLIVSEIPYLVYTNTICKELETLLEEQPDCGIERFNDLTGERPLIKIYLKRETNPQKVINWLYKNTSLQSYFMINFTMLEDGKRPKMFSWKECLENYISHIRSCKTREYQFDLDKALARENIVEGLIKACASIDRIIELIRSSENVTEAAQKLQSGFNFNEAQSKAILALKLSSLTRLDAIKLEKELEELKKRIEELEYLLSNSAALDNELIKILREVADKFGDERRTQVIDLDEETEEKKDKAQEEKDIAVVWDKKSIKVTSTKTRAKNAMFTTNYDSITVIGSGGKKYVFGLSELEPETEYRINELVSLASEKVLLLMPTSLFNSYSYVVTVSKQGFIKRSRIQEYVGRNKVAAKLDEGDELIGAFVSSNSADTILIVSDSNYYNYYEINEVGVTGRNTKGVKAIKLKTDEYVKYAVFFSCACTYDNVQVGSISIPYSSLIPTTRAIKGNKIGG